MISRTSTELTPLDEIHKQLYTIVCDRAKYDSEGTCIYEYYPEIESYFSGLLFEEDEPREEVPVEDMERILEEHLSDYDGDMGRWWIGSTIADDIAEITIGHDGWDKEERDEAEHISNLFFPITWRPDNLSFPKQNIDEEYQKAVQQAADKILKSRD